MNALLEGREIQDAIGILDDDLSVEHAALRQRRAQRRDELGKVALDWFRIPRPDEDLIAIAENDCPKAIPLWLILLPRWDLLGDGRQHRLHGRHYGQRSEERRVGKEGRRRGARGG